jgi:hypothetical protein
MKTEKSNKFEIKFAVGDLVARGQISPFSIEEITQSNGWGEAVYTNKDKDLAGMYFNYLVKRYKTKIEKKIWS